MYDKNNDKKIKRSRKMVKGNEPDVEPGKRTR